MKTFLLKLDNEVHKVWSEEAIAKKMTLSEFIRSAVNAKVGNGKAAVHDAGRAAGVRAPRRRAGVVGAAERTSVAYLAKNGTVTQPSPFDVTARVAVIDVRNKPDLPSAVAAARTSSSFEHSPNCPCKLCESKRKKVKK